MRGASTGVVVLIPIGTQTVCGTSTSSAASGSSSAALVTARVCRRRRARAPFRRASGARQADHVALVDECPAPDARDAEPGDHLMTRPFASASPACLSVQPPAGVRQVDRPVVRRVQGRFCSHSIQAFIEEGCRVPTRPTDEAARRRWPSGRPGAADRREVPQELRHDVRRDDLRPRGARGGRSRTSRQMSASCPGGFFTPASLQYSRIRRRTVSGSKRTRRSPPRLAGGVRRRRRPADNALNPSTDETTDPSG